MHRIRNLRVNRQTGQAVITAVVFLVILSGVVLNGITTPLVSNIKNTRNTHSGLQSYLLAESGAEDVIYRLKSGLEVDTSEVLTLDGSGVTTQTVDDGLGGKTITAAGTLGNYLRNVQAKIFEGEGTAFFYGLQVGNGGIDMKNDALITGNVFANGNISGDNAAQITGTAIAAAVINEPAAATNGTSTTPFSGINLGHSVTGITTVAQSFSISTTTPMIRFTVYIKKTGTPANLSVALMTNSNSGPGNPKPGSAVGGSGTLASNLVTGEYGWIEVYPSSLINLTPGTTYWLQLTSGGTSPTNYYTIGTNINGYNGSTYQVKTKAGSSNWATVSPADQDAYFAIHAGTASTIDDMTIQGNANALTVTNSTVSGNLYCQGGSGNNKACDTSQIPQAPLGFPVSEANIDEWKTQVTDVANAGPARGDWSLSGNTASTTGSSLKINGNLSLSNDSTVTTNGPLYIVGNLEASNHNDPPHAALTLGGPLYVSGNINISNDSLIKLGNQYGEGESEFIIVDGTVNTSNDAGFEGSGADESYLLVASKNGNINISNHGGSVVLVTLNGTVDFSNHSSAKAVVAYRMNMQNHATLNYEDGLANVFFSSGPSGGWQMESWKEVE